MYYTTLYASPAGMLTLASDGKNLVGLWIEGQKHYGASIPQAMQEDNNLPLFDTVKRWLNRYFAGEKPKITELSWLFGGMCG
jgi:methylated-DNA-[protein]-cysteine S-methyltransferase